MVTDKSREMESVYSELSDSNKDVMLLVAKSVAFTLNYKTRTDLKKGEV